MYRVNNNDDIILIVLIMIIIGGGGMFFFHNNIFKPKNEIKIDKVQKKDKSEQIKDSQVEINSKLRKKKDIFIHIGGAVKNPGVYKCEEGDRIYQVLNKAGGATKDADLNSINLVAQLRDGNKIIIPNKKEITSHKQVDMTSNKININLANRKKLEELTGIGPVTAKKIIDYRQQKGRFTKLEELKKVSGIGTKTFANLEGQITY